MRGPEQRVLGRSLAEEKLRSILTRTRTYAGIITEDRCKEAFLEASFALDLSDFVDNEGKEPSLGTGTSRGEDRDFWTETILAHDLTITRDLGVLTPKGHGLTMVSACLGSGNVIILDTIGGLIVGPVAGV